jgi:hypothetical protein
MISRSRSLNGLPDIKFEIELLAKLILPLLNQASRRNYKATLEITARNQFLDQQAGHDRFASARVIREEKSQWLPRQHFAIDCRYLVRQRIDKTCVNREVGIEIMGELDAISFRHQTQQRAIGIERPWPTILVDIQAMFVISVENSLGNSAIMVAVDDTDGLVADPVD